MSMKVVGNFLGAQIFFPREIFFSPFKINDLYMERTD